MFAQKIAYLYLVLLVSGCAHRDAPLATPYAAPPGWSTIATASQDTQSTSGAPTWPASDDAVLASLLERLECDNLELQSAAARLAASSAIADFAAAQRRPWLNVTVEGTRQRVPRTTFRDGEGQRHSIPPYRQSGYNAQLVLGYEIDLFGRLNHLQAGAEAGHAARAADLDSLRQRLRLETRLAFLALRHAESLIKENVAATTLLQRRIALLEARLDAGLIAIDTLRPIREALAVTQRDAAALRAERHVAHSRIAVLLGTPPAALSLPPDTETSGSTESLPGVPGSVPAELPAAVIARRPDIAAAWQNSLAASHDRERVRSERWPQLTLTSASGFISDSLGNWLRRDAVSWLLGLALQAPLLDGGRNAARQRVAGAEAQAAEADYRQQVITALGEVETALLRLQAAHEQDKSLAQQLATRQAHLDDIRASARVGRSDALARLDAELEMIALRRERLTGRYALLARWHETRHSMGY